MLIIYVQPQMDSQNRMELLHQILPYNQIYLVHLHDFIPVVDSEQFVIVEQSAKQGVSERRYPQRLNRRPPTRYRS